MCLRSLTRIAVRSAELLSSGSFNCARRVPLIEINFIEHTAAIRGVSRIEFVLQSSEAAAIEALNERPVIALDDEAWDDFVTTLDSPVEPDSAVKAHYARR